MRFVVIGKKSLIIAAATLIALTAALITVGTTGAYAVYSERTTRKLPIYCVDADEKKVALTFDASWGADRTMDILETLERYDAKATFFSVGFWAEKYSDKLKALSDSGRMEIGTHSNTHRHMTKLSQKEIAEELDESMRIIEGITGKRPELFRAPFGEYGDAVINAAEERGLYTIQWDVDTLDWKGLSAGEIAARAMKGLCPGSIILMHNDGEHTAEALPLILEGLKNKGYSTVTVGELIMREGYQIDHTGKQIRN